MLNLYKANAAHVEQKEMPLPVKWCSPVRKRKKRKKARNENKQKRIFTEILKKPK